MAVLDDESAPDLSLRFEKALTQLLCILQEETEPHSWATFVARCMYDNDDAFALIYEQAIAPMLERLVWTASQFSGHTPDDDALRLRVSAIVTAIFSFRFLRGVMLRGMDWEKIQNDTISQVSDMVHDLCKSEFITDKSIIML